MEISITWRRRRSHISPGCLTIIGRRGKSITANYTSPPSRRIGQIERIIVWRHTCHILHWLTIACYQLPFFVVYFLPLKFETVDKGRPQKAFNVFLRHRPKYLSPTHTPRIDSWDHANHIFSECLWHYTLCIVCIAYIHTYIQIRTVYLVKSSRARLYCFF